MTHSLKNSAPFLIQHNALQPLKKPSFVSPVKAKKAIPGTVTKKFQLIQYAMNLSKRIYQRSEGLDQALLDEIRGSVNKLTKYIFSGNQLPIINRNIKKNDSEYLYVHTTNNLFYSLMAARELGWNEEEAEHIGMAALLADIGYSKIDSNILKKEEELTEKEREEMQRHVSEGANMLAELGLPEEVVETVAFHHERFDGNGYPYGLRAEQINKNPPPEEVVLGNP